MTRTRRILAVTGLLTLVAAGLLALAVGLARPLGERLLRRALPWPGVTARIGAVRLHGVGRITLTGVRIRLQGASGSLSLDTLLAEFRPAELMRSPHRLRRVRAAGVRLEVVRGPEGWPLPPSAGTGSGRGIRIDRYEIDRGTAIVRGDSVRHLLGLRDFSAAGGLALAGRPVLDVRRAAMTVDQEHLPHGSVSVTARFGLRNGIWRVDSASATERGGDALELRGTVGPAGAAGRRLELRLSAPRIHPARFAALPLAETRTADLDLWVRGTTNAPEVSGRLDFGDAGALDWQLRAGLDGTSPSVALRARLRDLDLARLSEGRTSIAPIAGSVEGRMEGARLDSLVGPVHLDLRTVAGSPLRVVGGADVAGGLLRLALDLNAGASAARLRGSMRPLDPDPRYDLELDGRVRVAPPPAVREREPDWDQPWLLRARLVGSGFAPERMTGTVRARLEPVVPSTRTGPLVARGRMAGGELRVGADLAIGGGTVHADGRVFLRYPRRRWAVTDAEIRGVDLTPWTEGRVGPLYARGRATPAPGLARIAITIDSVTGGTAAGAAGALEATVGVAETGLAGALRLGAASLRIDTLELEGAVPRRGGLAFAGIDLSALAPDLPVSCLAGRISFVPAPPPKLPAEGLPEWARRLALAGRVTLDGASLGDGPLTGGADFTVAGGRLAFGLALAAGNESLDLAGSARFAAGPTTIRLTRGDFRRLDLRRWTGRGPSGPISGRVSGVLEGTDPATAAGDLTVELDSTRLGVLSVDSARATIALENGRATLAAGGNRGPARAEIRMDAGRETDGSWEGNGTARLIDQDTLAVQLTWASPPPGSDSSWRAALAGRGAVHGLRLDTLAVAGRLGRDLLSIDRAMVSGPELRLTAGGQLPIRTTSPDTADLVLEGNTASLGPLLRLGGAAGYDGSAHVRLTSTGPRADMQHELHLDIGRLRSSGVEVDSTILILAARSDSAHWVAAADARMLAGGDRRLLVAPGGGPLRVGLGTGGEGARHGTGLGLAVQWDAGRPSEARLTRLVAVLEGQPWVLTRPATVTWDDGVQLEPVEVRSEDGGVFRAAGRIAPEGAQGLQVEVTRLPLRFVGAGRPDGVAAALDLRLDLTGPAAAPRLELAGRLVGRERPVTFSAGWTGEGLDFHAAHMQPGGGGVDLDGSIPLRLTLAGTDTMTLGAGTTNVRAVLTDYELADLEPLLPAAVERLGGRLDAELTITGAATSRRLDGRTTVRGLELGLPTGARLSAPRVGATLDGNRLTVTEGLLLSRHGGRARVSGGVVLPFDGEGRLGLEASFDRFQAAEGRDLEAMISGTLRVGGRVSAPELTGSLHLDKATYWLREDAVPPGLERIELTAADESELRQRFRLADRDGHGRAGWWDATALDLELSAGSGVWARRPYDPALAVELAGDVRFTKPAGGDLRAEGTLNILGGRSSVEEFGRRFELTEGSVRFQGAIDSVALAARAVYHPREDVTIRLDVKGDTSGFALTLGSEPAMENEDIVSYLTVGGPAAEVREPGGMGGDVAHLGAGVLLSRVTARAEDLARRSLGLDVVEIRQEGLKGMTLVAGRYTTRRLFLGFEQPVVFPAQRESGFEIDDTELDAEYRVNEWLLANLSGTRSLVRAFLGVRHAY